VFLSLDVDVVVGVDEGFDVGTVRVPSIKQYPFVEKGVGGGADLAYDKFLVLCIGAALTATGCRVVAA
jgi:hypothetical protein